MRKARILGENPTNVFHVVTRVIERRFILGVQEREHLFKLIRAQEAFSGVRVLTWALMSNHFHLLVAVDDDTGKALKDSFSDEEILKRLGHLYSAHALREIEWTLDQFREKGDPKGYQKYRQKFLDRMFDLSSFVGEIKQRFSMWYNRREERKGPLWEDRFKSVLLEGNDGDDLVWVIGAYIDLNAVRAGIVEDPADYRHSGYGAAVGGDKQARKRIKEMLGMAGERWDKVARVYRGVLMERGIETVTDEGKISKRGIKPTKLEAERRQGYALARSGILRRRARYFTDSIVLGSKEFLNGVFKKNKRRMQVKRKNGARVPQDETLVAGKLRVLVDLRGPG